MCFFQSCAVLLPLEMVRCRHCRDRKRPEADTESQKNVTIKSLDQVAETVGNSPKEMGEFVAKERIRWKKVIDSAGVTLN